MSLGLCCSVASPAVKVTACSTCQIECADLYMGEVSVTAVFGPEV